MANDNTSPLGNGKSGPTANSAGKADVGPNLKPDMGQRPAPLPEAPPQKSGSPADVGKGTVPAGGPLPFSGEPKPLESGGKPFRVS